MECELRVREQREYRSLYCGLCKAINRRYGQFARLVLNYDCTFLAAFLYALSDTPHAPCTMKRCALKPFRGKNPVAQSSAMLDFAADANVLLAYHQMADDWMDERRFRAALGYVFLRKAAKKAAQRQPDLDKTFTVRLRRLRILERDETACTDEPADTFGDLLRELVLHGPIPGESERIAAGWMAYNLGRWIYLIDAWDDRQKDQKHGAYNPFVKAQMDVSEASFLLYVSLAEAEKAYDLLPINQDMGLLNNIIHLGCRQRTRQILNNPAKGFAYESV
jgi:hypothetical protein